MKHQNPRPLILVGSLIVAGLCTVMVDDGWLVWIPVLLAVLVFSNLQHRLNV